ncbi:hypothetical protein [Acetobacter lambici]|uniref:Uncharacterized protein n=1 Tax=Acetobacter lambici TaxID=1332824 RepID=A0ABT1F4B5_9PROT|nr:hypothetical protein [Acetobacter lambici]MCP1243968.1 hypothetical protein [Acetobacter lambici]MCP1260045.1 hypothetical protein [Acetobacter lambici]
MARKSAAERLKAAQEAVELADVRVSKAQERARLARCRVEKLAARTEQTKRRQDTRRKILLGAVVLRDCNSAGVEAQEAFFADLCQFMPPHDRELVLSSSIGDSYRRDTQRKATIGGALIAASRQEARMAELLMLCCAPSNFDKPADRALFEGWTP